MAALRCLGTISEQKLCRMPLPGGAGMRGAMTVPYEVMKVNKQWVVLVIWENQGLAQHHQRLGMVSGQYHLWSGGVS